MPHRSRYISKAAFFTLLGGMMFQPAHAHDPVFGLGPHVLFKGGIEITPEIHTSKADDREKNEFGMELTYGLTGDWAAGFDIPYANNSNSFSSNSGQGDISLFSKYRFWRDDGPGLQKSMAVAFKLKIDTGDSYIGSGTTDGILGLSYGFESRKWYRWSALRYRYNGENKTAVRKGDAILFDLVGGIRLKRTGYMEPDTVWLLELNIESTQNTELNGVGINNTGGEEWFVSPGIFWTKRNFAIKAGVQIPLISNLNGNQRETDYRAKLVLEWHI